MNRREFLGWVGVGWLASSLPIALAACNQQSNQGEVSQGTFEPVGTITDLDKQGFLEGKIAGGSVVVVKNPTNSNQVDAVNPTCTHAGCTVAWKADQKAFVCPCHESKFAADGKVVKGPAKDPLKTYEVKLDGDKVLVKT
ncbi:ubiquinol-cytochrome c reductase iron-sulfur subunit [Gloeothece verrucosa]|uniref:Rieske (2Fe-2S) iron-sulfur domain protein n=1 Tax=Gloeothece verrucosa (strain PCC 7822) TaxID=497965 RepID=E0UDW7_GLOV7|nr:ubiquinol-cytochrome c reductase iron-sulfur subunit [Gloeothece verrucosa]ADN16552.1 Rieske (2Fe-2S) iron-sulfur domain protein [Gloeothece verrucosa PCC 7822]